MTKGINAKERVHIAYVTQVDLAGSSGQNLYSRAVTTALANHTDVQLTLICPEPVGGPVDPMENTDVTVRTLPTKSSRSVSWNVKVQFPMIKALYQTHKESKIEGIVTTLKASNLAPPLFSFLFDIQMVLLVEGILVKNITKIQPFPGAPKIAQVVAFANAIQSQHVFTAYEEAEAWICSFPGVDSENVTVFYHGVDTKLFVPIDKDRARDEISLDIFEGDLVVGFVGSFKPYHCLDELLYAAHELRERGIDIRLLLVGDGPQRRSVEQIATDLGISAVTIFTGFVDHERVPLYVNACDILYGVIDPEHSGYPMKVHEYLACGRTVLAYEDDELIFIKKEDIGTLLNSVSPDVIADALEDFTKLSLSKREEKERAARRYICSQQTWDTYADVIINQINNSSVS